MRRNVLGTLAAMSALATERMARAAVLDSGHGSKGRRGCPRCHRVLTKCHCSRVPGAPRMIDQRQTTKRIAIEKQRMAALKAMGLRTTSEPA